MTQITILAGNWTMALADAIDAAQDGDEIVVNSEAKAELGQRALARMAPGKRVSFVVQEDDWL